MASSKNLPKKRGVCVICHGLNTDPNKMKFLGNFLESQSIETFLLRLSGHGENQSDMKYVSSSLWLKELYEIYLIAKKRALELKVPLYYLGYSLGGALNAALMNTKDDVNYDKIILFAPALAVRKTSYLIQIFKPFGDKFIIPSFAPKNYSAHKGISVAAYKALFEIMTISENEKYKKLNVPTLIFIDMLDELVSPGGLLKIKKKYDLDEWNFVYVSKTKKTTKYRMKHLILDEDSLGDKTWKKVQDEIFTFLQ